MRLLLRVTAGVHIAAQELLAMQTLRAAQALGLDNEIGSLEVGKKADLTFVDVADVRVHHLARFDNVEQSLSTLLDELSSHHVTDVMINGEFYVRRGEIMMYAEEDLRRETGTMLDRLIAVAGIAKEKTLRGEGKKWGGTILPFVPDREEQLGGTSSSGENEGETTREDRGQERGTGDTPHSPEPLPGDQPVELPKTVRRVFGDDDVS
jgi:hypothetical protein